jgi:general secretion pathway protein C
LTSRLLNPLLTFCFVVVSAFMTADIVNTVVKGALQRPPSFVMPRAVRTPVRSLPPRVLEAQIAAQPAVGPAPPVKLMGTTTGAYPSAVILAPAGKAQELYRLRDDVGGGWLIDEIGVNRVVLKNGDQKAVVEVKFVDGDPPNAQGIGATPSMRAGIRLDPRDVEGALSDLNKVMTQARVVPYLVGGKIAGYTIFDIAPASFYTKLGLQNNDVVERVNGVEIKSPDALYQLFQQIRNQPKIALDYSRNGRRETANIEIR